MSVSLDAGARLSPLTFHLTKLTLATPGLLDKSARKGCLRGPQASLTPLLPSLTTPCPSSHHRVLPSLPSPFISSP